MSAHELEKKELEENFEKLRLSLQVNAFIISRPNYVTKLFPLLIQQ